MDKESKVIKRTIIAFAVELFVLIALWAFDKIQDTIVVFLVYGVSIILLTQCILQNRLLRSKRLVSLKDVITNESSYAFDYAKIGLLTYNENFNITWMSDFFEERDIHFIGQKATKWIHEINQLFQGNMDEIVAEYEGYYYKIDKVPDSQMLVVMDVTETRSLENQCENEQIVIGLIHFDNYYEATRYEDETTVGVIDNQVKAPVIAWCSQHNVIVKRVKNDRYYMILNKEIYKKLLEDNFSVLTIVKEASKDNTIPITLSIAFSYGSNNFRELDDALNNSLELALERGGDQVVSKEYGKNTIFFGGNTEASENRNRFRVKVIAKSIKELAMNSSKVIILGHKTADFDCIGSAIGLSEIIKTYSKEVYIVYDENDVDPSCRNAIEKYQEELETRHHFVDENKALSLMDNNTLVILCDHHDITQTNAEKVLSSAKKVMVIDHHRRKGDYTFNPIMVYLEPGASSVSELVVELMLEQVNEVSITPNEATIMYTGILIDTNNFKIHVGSRTFEAAANLRRFNASPQDCFNLLKEDFSIFELKSKIMNKCEKFEDGIVIAAYDGGILSRTLLSQVANELLEIQSVEAAFVIGRLSNEECGISARSAGNINVQLIMEKMHGGGHFAQAGLQRTDTTVKKLRDELVSVMKEG